MSAKMTYLVVLIVAIAVITFARPWNDDTKGNGRALTVGYLISMRNRPYA